MKKIELIAGPCSVESYEQLRTTAAGLESLQPDYFRGGIWKPRSRPMAYEGVGINGLPWLIDIREEFGFPIMTEAGNAKQVEAVLKAGVDALWIGARTSVNPFYVQEIADALKDVKIDVFVKNPINPDLNLWIGALERLMSAGVTSVSAIHRGFSAFGDFKYRNQPHWSIPINLMQEFPDMKIVCDPSHISGDRSMIHEISQLALDLRFDGLMIESHYDPENAMSDSKQQLLPTDLIRLIDKLVIRRGTWPRDTHETVNKLRDEIDNFDRQIIRLLAQRMDSATGIGKIKADNDIPILQPKRWQQVLENAMNEGKFVNLQEDLILAIYNIIHEESIRRQITEKNNLQLKDLKEFIN
jgi:chorismate mutase